MSSALPKVAFRGKGFVALRGIATNVSRQTRAEGDGAVSAFYEIRFQLDGLTVVSRMVGRVLEVETGEKILVAGYFNGAEIWPQAWWNRSTGVGYDPTTWYYWPLLILAIGVLALGSVMICINPDAYRKIAFSFLFPFLLLSSGAYSAYYRRRAIKAIRTMKTQKGLKRR